MISEGYKTYIKERIGEYISEHNKLPSKNDIDGISMEPLIGEYGSWKNVLIDFGFLKNIKCEEIFEELLKLQSKLKHPLRLSDIKKSGLKIRPLLKKYGSWGKLKSELTTHLPNEQKKREGMGEEFLKKVKEEEIKLIELTKKYNKVPTAKLARENNINVNRLLIRYKTWNGVKREINLEKIIYKLKS